MTKMPLLYWAKLAQVEATPTYVVFFIVLGN
jgi:hypothetical protein